MTGISIMVLLERP